MEVHLAYLNFLEVLPVDVPLTLVSAHRLSWCSELSEWCRDEPIVRQGHAVDCMRGTVLGICQCLRVHTKTIRLGVRVTAT